MNLQQKAFWETIKIFSDLNILDGFILIGSWAEYLYEASNYFGFKSYLKTMDADLLIKNLRFSKNVKVDLSEVFEKHGYVKFTDSFTGVTKFYKDGVLEVEFLVRELGKGQIEAYKVDGLGVKAEGLRHMEILCNNTTWLDVNGYCVCVPTPQAYIMHKLVINDKRGNKKEKDLRAVKNLLKYVLKSEDEVLKLKAVYDSLFKNEKKKVDKVCKESSISF